MRMLKNKSVVIIWCLMISLLMPCVSPILALAQENIPAITVGENEYKLSVTPYENELGIMISAEDAVEAFSYGYRFDSENKLFEIFTEQYGKVTLMHKATVFFSGDSEFNCLPYFYVENGVPMIEIGFFCKMFNSSFEYDRTINKITIFKDLPNRIDNVVSDDIMLMSSQASTASPLTGNVQLPSGFEHKSNVNVRLIITPCTGPTKVWAETYIGGRWSWGWVTKILTGTPEYVGDVILESGVNQKEYNYEIPDNVLTSDYPFYMMSYIVSKDDSYKLNPYGSYKNDDETISLGSSPEKGAFSGSAYRFDITGGSPTITINIPTKGTNKSSTYDGYYRKNISYNFRVRDIEKMKYSDENVFDITIGNETWTTGEGGNVKTTPDNIGNAFTIAADGYMPFKLSTDFLKKYFWNSFAMYKLDYSKKPEVHAVYYNSKNVFQSDNREVIYSGDTTSTCTITPVINENGKKIKNVKVVQGQSEVPVSDLEYIDAGTVEGKTYRVVTGSTGKIVPGVVFSQINEPIYLVVTTTLGETTKVKLNLTCAEWTQNNMDVDLGDEISFSSDEEKDQILGGMSFKYKLFDKLPADFKLTPAGDGNYTFKATLGVESKDKEKIYETMDDYYTAAKRDAFDDAEYGGKNAVQKFDNFFKKLADENIATKDNLPSAELGKTCALKLFGYLEGSYNLQTDNSYKLSVSEGGMSAKFSFDSEVQRQIFINGVPCYWTAGLGFADAVTVPLYSTGSGLAIPDSVDNEFDITIKGGGGVGVVGAATVGASGEGELAVTMTIPLDKDTTEAIVSGKINIFDYQLGILSGSLITLKTPKLQLYPEVKVLSVDEVNEVYTEQLSRDYVEDSLTFNVEGIELMGLSEDNININENTIVENTYTFSNPQILETNDGNMLLVWVEDERSRQSDADRTAIYYTYYSKNTDTWSEPQIVFDDGKADFAPELKKVNGNIYLLWSNASENFETQESDANKIAKSLGISVAVWNGQSFNLMGNIDENGVILKDITEIDNHPTVVFTTSEDGDLLQTDSKTVMKKAVYDNMWNVEVLQKNQQCIDGMSVMGVDDKLSVYYSQDTDGNVETINDKEIFVYHEDSVERLTSNEFPDTKPTIVNDTLYWYSNSQIAYRDVNSDDVGYIDANCLSDGFNVITNGTKSAVVFESYNEDGDKSLAAVYNDNGGWGKPINIYSSENFIGGYSSAYCSDGILRAVSNDIIIGDDSVGKASIKMTEVKDFCDISIDDVFYDEYSTNGDQLWIYYTVTNKGNTKIDSIRLQAYDENDKSLSYSTTNVTLLPGETYTFGAPCWSSDCNKVRIEVSPYYKSSYDNDINTDDNQAEIDIYRRDVSVENIVVETENNKNVILGYIFNRGTKDVSDVNVYLRKDTSDGEVVESLNIATIKAGDYEQVIFELDDTNDGIYYITCDELENENLIGNNSDFCMLTAGMDSFNFEVTDFVYDKAEDNIELSIQTKNETTKSKSLTLIAAFYDNNGVLIKSDIDLSASFDIGENTIRKEYDCAGMDDSFTIKVFAWNNMSLMAPVGTAFERTVQK